MKNPATTIAFGVPLTKQERRMRFFRALLRQRWLFFMLIPGVIWMIIFNYIPMYGIVIAFKNFTILDTFGTAPWVGFKHFIEFFQDEKFSMVMRNTIGISALKLIFGFPLPIILAIMLNELYHARFKKFVQTVSYLPHFFSWVVLGGIMLTWLSESGILNEVLIKWNVIENPRAYMTESELFWGIAVASDIWKEVGWNAIIYLAAISGIAPELYEAARIDGASRMQRIWHVTLPSISGITVILLVLAVSSILNTNFDQMLILQNALNVEASEVIDTLVYKLGIRTGRFSYATAVGFFKSIVAMILLISANLATRKIGNRSLF